MDLNNLTAIGRSWVGNVCQKVEVVFQEMDAIMKQNKSNQGAEQGQATSKMVKNLRAEVTDEVGIPRSSMQSEDRLLDRNKNAGTSGIPGSLVNVEETPIQVGNLSVIVDDDPSCTACSVANIEDKHAQVNKSLTIVDTPGRNNSGQVEAELRVPGKDKYETEAGGPDAENQLVDLAFAGRPEGQLEKICKLNTMDCEDIQGGDVALESHLVAPIPEHPVEGAESRICQEINSNMTGDVGMFVVENAMNEELAPCDLKSIPLLLEELSDACECIQLMNDNGQNSHESEAKLSMSSSVHGNEAVFLLSHDENDRATLSEQSSGACSEERSQKAELERLSNPPVLQSICSSGTLLESFSVKSSSPDILSYVKEHDADSSSLLVPSMLSATDDSSYDVLGLDMETVDLTDEGEELGGNVDIINNNELHALSLRVQNFRSLKKKLRDAFAPKKRLAKEYKHLGILYGDIDIRLAEEPQPTPSTLVSSVLSGSKNPRKLEVMESEWVLL